MKTFFEIIHDQQFHENATRLCHRLASMGIRPMTFVEWFQDEGFARPDTSVDWFLNETGYNPLTTPWHPNYQPPQPAAAPAQPASAIPAQPAPQMPTAGAGTAQPDPSFASDVKAAVDALSALRNLPPINGRDTFLQKHQLDHAVNSLMQYMSAFSGQMPSAPAPSTPEPDAGPDTSGQQTPGGDKGPSWWDKTRAGLGAAKDYMFGKDFRQARRDDPYLNAKDWIAQRYQSNLRGEGVYLSLDEVKERLISEYGPNYDQVLLAPSQPTFLEHIRLRRTITEIAEYIDPEEFVEWYLDEGQYYDDPVQFENAFGDFMGKVGGAIRGAWQGISRGWKATGFKQQRQKKEQAINTALQALQKLQTTHGEYMKSVPGGEAILPHLDQVLAALKKAAGIEQQQDAQADAQEAGGDDGTGSEQGDPNAQQPQDPNHLAGQILQGIDWNMLGQYIDRSKASDEAKQEMKNLVLNMQNPAGKGEFHKKLSEYLTKHPKMQTQIASTVMSGGNPGLYQRIAYNLIRQMQGENRLNPPDGTSEPTDGVSDPTAECANALATVLFECYKKQSFLERYKV